MLGVFPTALLALGMLGVFPIAPFGFHAQHVYNLIIIYFSPGALPAGGARAELSGRAGVDAAALGAHLAAPALLVARAAGLAGPVESSPFSDLIHNKSESLPIKC